MTVKWNVRLFAGLADRFGGPSAELELPEDELTVGQLKDALAARYPAHAQLIAAAFMARNQAYAADGEPVRADDELALLPPVSGGEDEPAGNTAGDADARYRVTPEPLSVEAVTAQVIVPNNGAALTFTGTTREWTHGQRTVRLEYEAYVPMAVKTLRQIGDEIAERWPGTACAIWHRTGVVDIAEISVVIAVSSPHREGCYEASRYAIERLKQIVPIWKREIWEDGSEWKGHQQGPWDPLAQARSEA
ncbi:molybdenum cofactor biosynthesis protein MoaE [Paenibacillus sp. MWE-103]|uniref:Molybdenum cofactor biosynthesis protein MoaE n=1 Tax=Paenibacillus artemisiicola TaxID=1172618 RepID=A0ABS3WAF5_9BACL|nr:molybdenum cofactor biosynthesis protein MoaE [Paenibacillus artemisiicola]MBO7745289.1 molybdenum cofactor biosynthesis protein MoaE [Paenibacillus artemisiicola]